MGALDIPAPGGLDRRSLALVSDAAGQAALGERGPALGGVIVGVQVHGDVVGQRAEIVQQVQGGREEWGIMAVGRGYDATARYSLTICHAGSLQAELVPVDRERPAAWPPPRALVMQPSMAISSSTRPTMRSYASRTISLSWAKTPSLIHSSRRFRMVVAEQVVSAMAWFEQPNRRTCRSLSKMIRLLIRCRWYPSGCLGRHAGLSGSRAANWSHSG